MQRKHQSNSTNYSHSRPSQETQYLRAENEQLYRYTEGQQQTIEKLTSDVQKLTAEQTILQEEYKTLSTEKEEWMQKAMAAEATRWESKWHENQINQIQQQNTWLQYHNTHLQHQVSILSQYPAMSIWPNMPLSSPAQAIITNTSLSSAISIPKIQPDTFETRVFKLAENGLEPPAYLEPLRTHLPDEVESSEYFEQFVPYIMEEIRASINAQLDTISHKRLRPFFARGERIPPEKDIRNQQHVRLNFSTVELPKLDHGFYMEAVFIEFESALSKKQGHYQKREQEKSQGFLAIASSDKSVDEENNKKQYFSILIPKQDYLENIDQWQTKPNISIHWLHGLIPSSRSYQACVNMPKVSFEAQFIRGRLNPWPLTIPEPSASISLSHLNPSQRHVLEGLRQAESGLYLVQGPPGTGKTTTTVQLLGSCVRQYPSERMLVCAPSNQALRVLLEQANTALPEVLMALTGVGKDLAGVINDVFVHNYVKRFYQPLIVLKRKLEKITAATLAKSPSLIANIKEEHSNIIRKIEELLSAPGQMPVDSRVQDGMHRMRQKFSDQLATLPQELLPLIAQLEISITLSKENAHIVEAFLVQRAQIVFATLVASGRHWLQKQIANFAIVIIDEASQALVPEALIPLRFNPKLCVHVGDPNQLPATVVSRAAQTGGYATSLMSWLMKDCQQPYQMLTEQYRMQPDICQWPSEQYYEGQLTIAPSVLARESALQNARLAPIFKQPSVFFNINGSEERRGENVSASIYNDKEALAIVRTLHYLLKCGFDSYQLGIITFYSAQVDRIIQQIDKIEGEYRAKARQVTVSTVDGFQGAERDITLISMVRSSKSVGFLSDPRRINVAMTRAKDARWLFGNSDALGESNSDLPNFFRHASFARVTEQELMQTLRC